MCHCEEFMESVSNKGIYARCIKRPLDITLSLLGLILLSPLLLVVAFLIKIRLGSPIIFKQQRPGLNEKIFTLYKFRTMADKRDEKGELLPDSDRLTRFGKWLRSTSLDELPELWNILKGDMSLVGPRPLLVEYLPLYDEYQRRRHVVRPGLTGLAQINGRNAISWEEKFEYDVEYVNDMCFILDWKILLQTIIKVSSKEGVNTNTDTITEAFKGTEVKGRNE